MANIKDCFIESHKLFYSREMECNFGYGCLCPTERVPNDAFCGLSSEHPTSSHPESSGKSMIVTLPKSSTTARFRLGQINTLQLSN